MRGRYLSGSVLAAALFCACGLSQQGSSGAEGGAAGSAGTGGTGVSTGTCFPGAKVCPDAAGNLVCLTTASADTGCNQSACSPCVVPHATATCNDTGACSIGACDAGFADCNSDPTDGCETNLGGDPTHCGSCTLDCTASGGPSVCQAGVCKANNCNPPTWLDCNNDGVCETDGANDPQNCLFCGNVCDLSHATSNCVSQKCVVVKCDAGWGDCDGNPANGCETELRDDPSNCGACGTACASKNGVAGCSDSKCGILCNPGFGDCNKDPSDGCEADFSSDALDCNGCGKVCPAGTKHLTPTCSNAKCGFGGCLPGWGDCDGHSDNGCEADLTNNAARCGSCTTTCPPPPSNGAAACIAGVCGVTCSNNYGDCSTGTTCFKIQTDPAHCGTDCKVCQPPPSGKGTATCANFSCGVSCAGGYTACAGDCVDLKTDVNDCGKCGTACDNPVGQSTCVNGACNTVCGPPLTGCGPSCVDLTSDHGNCGSCGHDCAAKSCVNGSCV